MFAMEIDLEGVNRRSTSPIIILQNIYLYQNYTIIRSRSNIQQKHVFCLIVFVYKGLGNNRMTVIVA